MSSHSQVISASDGSSHSTGNSLGHRMLLGRRDRPGLEEVPAVVGVGGLDIDRGPERTLDLETQPDQLVTDVVGERGPAAGVARRELD